MKKIFTLFIAHCLLIGLCEDYAIGFMNPVQAAIQDQTDVLGEDQGTVSGTVIAFLDKTPLTGVNIIVKGTLNGTVTDINGRFFVAALPEDTLTFSFIGYETTEIPLHGRTSLQVELMEDIEMLDQLEIVSTGYRQLPKERATGSFVRVDNKLINRGVSTGIMERLKHVVPGLSFRRSGALYPEEDIIIRGRSTLFANGAPLVIVDNFPYEGHINNINPNDVESVTVLKDAAAASIWGARAGNGVIVITTKTGEYNRHPQVSFNSNVTIRESPDPYYVPRMSTDDYIDTEIGLFESGFHTAFETSKDNRALSPLVELLIAKRDGLMSADKATEQIQTLREQDVRRDFKYFYRESINQQYAVNVAGGSEQQRFFLSAGYDHNRKVLTGDVFKRITLNAKNTWSFFDKKLKFSGGIHYTKSWNQNNGVNPDGIRLSNSDALPPYVNLVDRTGSPLPIIQDYRNSFVEAAEANGLLDWHYTPLKEVRLTDKTNNLTDYLVNAKLLYKIFPSLQATFGYQYWNSGSTIRNHYPLESYYARDMINRYTQMDEDGNLDRPIPVGGILDKQERVSHSHNFRAQLNYVKQWQDKHEVNILAGYEVKETETTGEDYRFYGYDGEIAISSPVDYTTRYSQYYYPARRYTIPFEDRHVSLTDRFISYYANASYVFDGRYMVSLSGRKDQSNLFGVNANQRGVPLWSVGGSWNMHEEDFYHWDWLPFLKFRATYGYNGNIDKSLTAFTTARFMGNNFNTGLPYAVIISPPNADLQWERVQVKNFGLDFSIKNDRLKGSIEYYTKNGKDLIGYMPLSPASGQELFRGNVAATEGHGLDLTITSRNLDGKLKWDTHWLFSTAVTKVSGYEEEPAAYQLLQLGDRAIYPVEGRELYGLYSYPWAGLDPVTGDPQGYVDGEVSKDYGEIIERATVDSLRYHGPAQPTTFGALRNIFTWKNLSLSFNISYRLGHYFRRESIIYGSDKGLGGHGDYNLRWRAPGDEAFTDVPSIPDARDTQRDDFYTYSEALIEKGDNVRFEDIRLTYTLRQKDFPALPFQQVQLYGYADNLGILWKATDKVPDPEHRMYEALRSYAIGLSLNF